MIEIDGAEIVSWVLRATDDELSLLVNSEYSDADDIWIIRSAKKSGLGIVKDGQTQLLLRPYGFFRLGTFFLDDDVGIQVKQKIDDSLPLSEKRVVNAKMFLATHGFLISEFSGDSFVLMLADAIMQFENNKKIPDGNTWEEIHEQLTNSKTSIKKCGVKFVSDWVLHSEAINDGLIDVYKRVLLATLYRHSGQLEKALEASDIVDLPRERLNGGKTNISVLCTTRGATMMDIAENQPARRDELLQSARRSLNKANAMSVDDSTEIMEAYKRLKYLEGRG